MTKVKNIKENRDFSCKCESGLKVLETSSGTAAKYCAGKDCYNTIIVGAHVQKDGSADTNWYIVPLYKAQNNETGVQDVVGELFRTTTELHVGISLEAHTY